MGGHLSGEGKGTGGNAKRRSPNRAWILAAGGIVAVTAAAMTAAVPTIDQARGSFSQYATVAGTIPPNAREDAIARMRAMASASSASQPGWQPVAPGSPAAGDDAARPQPVRAIAIDPSDPTGKTIYVGAEAGGVWKTTDGEDWTPLTDDQPSLAIRSLALDATTSPVTIYAGTGARASSGESYYGAGVLKSVDGGRSWTSTGSKAFSSRGGGDISVESLSVSPNASTHRVVLAAVAGSREGIEDGVWRSVDGGTAWAPVLTAAGLGGEEVLEGYDVAFDPSDRTGQISYAAVGRRFSFAPACSPAACGGIYVSNDGGATWTRLTGLDQAVNPVGIASISLAIGPQIAGKTILYATVWDSVPHSADSPAIFKSADSGATWKKIAVPSSELCISACGDAITLTSSATDPSLLFAAGVGLARSTDGGNSWQDVTVGQSGTALSPWQHALALGGANGALYVGNQKGVWNSADVANAGVTAGGHTWNHLNGSSGNALLDIAEFDSTVTGTGSFEAGGHSVVLQMRMPGTLTRSESASANDPRDAQVSYRTLSGFSGINGDKLGHVFESAGGGPWRDISGNLPNIPASAIVVDPALANTLYVATDIGVFSTSDGGASWSPLGTGLPIVPVTALTLQAASRVLTAGTYGRGTWELSLGSGTDFRLTSISPTAVAAGAASFTLHVKGSGFTKDSAIRLNTTQLSAATLQPDGSLSVLVPGGMLKTGATIKVSVVDGGAATNSLSLEVTNPVPTISSVSPTSITVGNGLFDLTVTGTNFVEGSVVNFGVTSLTATGSTSSTSITVQVPTNAIATAAVVNVSVTNPTPGGGTSNTEAFDIQDYAFGTISPSTVTVQGGFTATYKIPIIALNGFNVPLTLTCAGEPGNATCYFNPTSVIPTASGATEVVLVTTESNASGTLGRPGQRPPPPYKKFLPILGALFGALLILGWFATRAGTRAWRRRFALATSLAGIAFAGVLAGCGSSNGGTPVGTYLITLTAAETQVNGVTTVTIASHEVMVTLIVTQTNP